MKFFLILAIFTFASVPAFADIHDRINSCERGGGGSCIYSILRELAGGVNATASQNKCKCSTHNWSPGDNCKSVSDSVYLLMRDGNLVKKECKSTKDAAYVACIKESNKNEVCR